MLIITAPTPEPNLKRVLAMQGRAFAQSPPVYIIAIAETCLPLYDHTRTSAIAGWLSHGDDIRVLDIDGNWAYGMSIGGKLFWCEAYGLRVQEMSMSQWQRYRKSRMK